MSYFFTIIYILIVMIRPQEFVEAVKAWPILDVMAILCIASAFLEGRITSFALGRSATNKILAIFWIWISFTVVANGWMGGGLQAFMDFARITIIFYLVILTADTFPRIRLLLWVIILATSALAMQAIIQFYTGTDLAGAGALTHGDVVQAKGIGIFSDPNDLALAIVIWIPFLLPFIHRGFLSPTMWTGIIVLIPVITGVVFTRSRGGLLGLAAVFWYYFYKRVGLTASVLVLVVVFTLLLSIPRMDMDAVDAKEGSARSRLDHWSAGLDMLKQSPIVGMGKGSFTEHHYRTAHNSFVLALAETGLVGAILWIMLFFSTARDLWLLRKDPRGPPELYFLVNGLIGSLIGWHVCAFFLSHTYKFQGYLLMALAVAALRAMDNQGIYIDNPFEFRHIAWSTVLTMIFIVFFYFGVRLLWGLFNA